MRRILLALLLLSATLAGCASSTEPTDTDNDGFTDEQEVKAGSDPQDATSIPLVEADMNGDGVVVVAVVDGGFNPYHMDMVGSLMPQHLDGDVSNDLPLYSAPHEWIPGFPDPEEAFASYTALNLDYTYAFDADNINASLPSNQLYANDAAEWKKVVAGSTVATPHYHYIPGSKVVGYVNVGGGDGYAATSHGVGTSTVSVGNIHGSCPECLLVFVNNGGERETANNWVLEQDWIDVQTNSYGYSTAFRDRMYAGSDVEAQKEAVLNGQAIFFSAGNGQDGAFVVANPTLFSSQEGPDWIVTVGAIDPNTRDPYQGHGRPSDVASFGGGYPSGGYCPAATAGQIGCSGDFGGTSNATPVTAGMYAKALYELRKNATIARPSDDKVVIGDGWNLTAPQLMDALFLAAEHKGDGISTATGGQSIPVNNAEMQFLAEGHGSFVGRLDGDDAYNAEWQRIVSVALGGDGGDMIDGEEAWFINDSYCRQTIWGEWSAGWYDGTNLPGPDPTWPVRTALQIACPTVVATVVDVECIRDGC